MKTLEAIGNKLQKNYKHRAKWARKNKIEAYRIYDREIPDYPYIVDIYGEFVVIYSKTKDKLDSDKTHHLDHIIDSVLEICQTTRDKIILKKRKIQTREDKYEKNKVIETESTEEIFDKKAQSLIINEHQAKIEVNLVDYIDTGLFLDHRPLRQMVYELIKKENYKSFLNLFSYTCSVSVFAALAGAKTTSIDLSKKYLEWGKRNFQINELNESEHHFISSDILEYLKTYNLKKEKMTSFDLIFLDPPTFSNSKKMEKHFDVDKDQLFLVDQCMSILNPKGQLYFSNNLRSFKLDESILKKYSVINLTNKSIPQDFKDQKIHHLFEITHKD